jgi:hypothetical protein
LVLSGCDFFQIVDFKRLYAQYSLGRKTEKERDITVLL